MQSIGEVAEQHRNGHVVHQSAKSSQRYGKRLRSGVVVPIYVSELYSNQGGNEPRTRGLQSGARGGQCGIKMGRSAQR